MKQQKNTPFLMALVCAAALVTFGEDEPWAYARTGITNDKGLSGATWSTNGARSGDVASTNLASYRCAVIRSKFTGIAYEVYTKSSGETFPGVLLQVGQTGTSATDQGIVRFYGQVSANKFVFVNGKIYTYNGSVYSVNGPIVVQSSLENPFLLTDCRSTSNLSGFSFDGKLESESTAALLVRGDYNNYTLNITADASNYKGLIRVDSASASLVSGLKFNDGIAYGGSILVSTNSYVQALGDLTIAGDLTFDGGAMLNAVVGKTVAVSGNCRATNGVVKLSLTGVTSTTPSELTSYDVLSMPVAAEVSPDDFTVVSPTSTSVQSAGYVSFVTNDLKTVKILRVSYYPTVSLVTKGATTFPSATNPNYDGTSDGTYWSDGEPVHSNAHYSVSRLNKQTTGLNTPSSTDSALTFPGVSLTLNDYTVFSIQAADYTVPLTVVAGDTTIQSTAGRETTFRSAFTVKGTLGARGKSGSTLTFAGSISGGEGGLIDLYTTAFSTSDSKSNFKLDGDNSGYAGKIRLGSAENGETRSAYMTSDDDKSSVLHLLAANNLGGARSDFTYNALMIGQRAMLTAENSVTLDEPTRGIYVYGRSQFNVLEGKTLDIREQLTLSTNGTYSILKKGAGTLALGGNLRWLLGDAPGETRPSDVTTNRLEVSAGGIRATAARAMDGLDIVFTSDAATISVDASATDSDLKTYGFINLKTSAPLVTSAKTGAVPVTLENLPENPVAAFSVPVCTVRATAAAGVLAALTTTRKVLLGDSKCRVALAASDPFELDGQQAVTIKADVTPPVGAILWIR